MVRRFIPAWAGNTLGRYPRQQTVAVHPRVGGEHGGTMMRMPYTGGSSPRGRGTPSLDADRCLFTRFIPAWAGNTNPATGLVIPDPVHPRVGGEHIVPVKGTRQ